MLAGWCSWFVTGLLYPRFQTRPRYRSVDFPDAKNQQRPCRMIIRQGKRSLEHPFDLDAIGKFKIPKYKFCIGRAQVPPTGGQNYLR
ncbi:hypothetical protein TNCV_3855661 [Trichonephila clavipes]|nr:hypothetical protein TNCV_3855661 [Trichonephila clavipes]